MIALAGGVGSGKSTIGRMLADRTVGDLVGFGDYVRHLATQAPAEADRFLLQGLGQRRVELDPERFVRDFLEWAAPVEGRPLIVDGVRHAKVDRTLRHWATVSKRDYGLILIKATTRLRAERRAAGNDEEIFAIDTHPVERETFDALPAVADLVVDGDDPPEDVLSKIILLAQEPLAYWLR